MFRTQLLVYFIFLACAFKLDASPKVVSFDLTRREVVDTSQHENKLRRREKSVGATLYNAQSNILYLVNGTVGTPPQRFSLQLDTGSSDIWIPWVGSTACLNQPRRCVNGAYDDRKSTTYASVSPKTFRISYVDKTTIAGDYIDETFGIGGVSLQNMTMGLAKVSIEPDTTSPFQGIVGVGFDQGEAIYAQKGLTYPNIISQLQRQGYINTKAYSLWLNDRASKTGNLLFGGIDYSKFEGDLTILPLQPDPQGGISSFSVVLDNFNIVGAQSVVQYSTDLHIPVIFDSGTTMTYLPNPVAISIAAGVGAVASGNYGVVVPCAIAKSPATLNFQFGNKDGPKIVAKISQFVLPFPEDVPKLKFRNGKTACRWGILPSGDNPNLFGDTFLRSAYLVYNIDGGQVGIAQTKFNVEGQEIREISAISSLPGATSTASGAARQTFTGSVHLGGGGSAATATVAGPVAETQITGTFDLGSPTATSTRKDSQRADAGNLQPSSRSTVIVVSGFTALLAMMGGSLLIFW